VNETVRNTSGGPWTLFSYIGFAPERPFSPESFGYTNSTNLTLKYCQGQFNGLTLWNGTAFPIFNGSVASGTATFWQFAFFSISGQQIIVATDILGVPRVYGALPVTNPCMKQSTMAKDALGYISWVNPIPVDTSVQAANAYDVEGRDFSGQHSPLVEMFINGWVDLSDATNHGMGAGVEYTQCGLAGEAGLEPKGVVGEYSNGVVQNTFNGSLSCTAVAAVGPPVVYVPYAVALSAGANPGPLGGGLASLALSMLVEFLYPNGTVEY